ncbi:alpha-galactosidase [Paenibacillus sp. LC-T2]|uniref:Alpha-galactosidase n=2 Tax=Paenibacillus monticola TaxID=2666075 RepID=A0A7X2H989_9BACL|nr:alpha-galactosidase [Paenibacillus monticola]MRN55887.1 alpha-galactosidase [Paenibacillus monticola]
MNHSSYIFGINEKGAVQHLYWGKPVVAECADLLKIRHHSSFDADLNRTLGEYGGWGGSHYAEPCLKVKFNDGVRDLKLQYSGYELVQDNQLVLRLTDVYYRLRVEVCYTSIDADDLLERGVKIYNDEAAPLQIDQVMAAAWSIPAMPSSRLTHVAGRWAGEYQLRTQLLTEGKKVLESRSGFTGPHANPWFAMDNGKADETSGQVWFGALGWSGNWKIVAEKSNFGHVHIVGGINDFDSAFTLAPGESYTSPVFTGGFVSGGFGEMSRNLHHYQSTAILPSSRVKKVLYNSWEATEFAVEVQGQKALAAQAARLGVERFVVDDGWFGSRSSDRAGLGDWQVNPEKFPQGLQELIDEVKRLGMDFGLWVEPESVNPDSDLYRLHPDWVYQFPTREGTLLRNQLLLNLGKPEVKEFVLDFMTELLSTYDISFIKWDMNRTVTEPGAVPLLEYAGQSVWIKHVDHLYEIWAELRSRFPYVEFETCAGGGARIDLGILRFADQAWISDNTDARDRLTIQEGFSYVYNPSVMMCWVTESPHNMNGRSLPLSFRFHSAMMGGLGIGANIGHWSDEAMAEALRYVEQYKQIRHVIAEGSMYRLASFRDGDLAAYQYISPDQQEIVIFAFQQAQYFGYAEKRLVLQGLAHDAQYQLEQQNNEPDVVWHGSNLLNIGLPLTLSGDYASQLIRLKRVP